LVQLPKAQPAISVHTDDTKLAARGEGSQPFFLLRAFHCIVYWVGLLWFASGLLILNGGALLLGWLPGIKWPEVWSYVIQKWLRLTFASFKLIGCMDVTWHGKLTEADLNKTILIGNHPTRLDALWLLAKLPNVRCVYKSSLKNSIFSDYAAQATGFIPNSAGRDGVRKASQKLTDGVALAIFPEGTRTEQLPLNPMQAGYVLIAKEAGADIQTLIVQCSSAILTKRVPLLRPPRMSIHYNIYVGRRFKVSRSDSSRDVHAEIEQYMREQISRAPSNLE
jgi:1-acyl-sn-glycerol-3-phosphate acyltransferase